MAQGGQLVLGLLQCMFGVTVPAIQLEDLLPETLQHRQGLLRRIGQWGGDDLARTRIGRAGARLIRVPQLLNLSLQL